MKAPSISITFKISGLLLSTRIYELTFLKVSKNVPSQNIGADFLMAVGMSLKFGSSSQIANLFGIYW